ncbi:hypothetical protein [Nocardia wallacei]|uniref:hypothetical protein n=1 Tax=Nocardia wallacei TaxID=480035 RepID=UPI002453FA22|nr:hypothetical protein [Nocardia wallacei]
MTLSDAEPQPGTYWERVVLRRFAEGDAVDLDTVRSQVGALLRELPKARRGKLYGCSKRNCEAILHDWEVFETGWPDHIRHWCLHHIPRPVRLKMWLRGGA